MFYDIFDVVSSPLKTGSSPSVSLCVGHQVRGLRESSYWFPAGGLQSAGCSPGGAEIFIVLCPWNILSSFF